MCEILTTDKNITFKDKGSPSKMTFINNSRLKCKKITVDGCLITTGSRCDFLLIDQNGIEYFVELKGSDILKGCDQLSETIKRVSMCLRTQKHAFIVSSFVPKIRGSIQIKQLYFKKQYNSKLTIKNKECQHEIS